MTILPNKPIEKQAWEAFYISGSILKVQTDTDTVALTDSIVVAEDKDKADVSTTFLEDGTKSLGNDPKGAFLDNLLMMRIQSGTKAKSPYKVTFRMKTTEGNKWEVDRIVNVTDDP